MDTIRTTYVHVYSHLDPMDTSWTKEVHVYGHLEEVARATSGGALAATGGGMQWHYAVRSCRGGVRPPTADVVDYEVAAHGENSMSAARGGNRMPKSPDAADESEVMCAAKGNLEERQLQTTHLPHTPTR